MILGSVRPMLGLMSGNLPRGQGPEPPASVTATSLEGFF